MQHCRPILILSNWKTAGCIVTKRVVCVFSFTQLYTLPDITTHAYPGTFIQLVIASFRCGLCFKTLRRNNGQNVHTCQLPPYTLSSNVSRSELYMNIQVLLFLFIFFYFFFIVIYYQKKWPPTCRASRETCCQIQRSCFPDRDFLVWYFC